MEAPEAQDLLTTECSSPKHLWSKKRHVKTLIVFSGPCGAGKSTLARMECSKLKHTALVCRDDLRRMHPRYDDSDLTKTTIKLAARLLDSGGVASSMPAICMNMTESDGKQLLYYVARRWIGERLIRNWMSA